MEVTQTSLVITGANTTDMKVYWNGAEVSGLKYVQVTNDMKTPKVILTVAEDPTLAELQSAGIQIRRV